MGRILVVEDDEGCRVEIAGLLRDRGYSVTAVADLAEGLRAAIMLREGDVVLTDKNLGAHRGIKPLLDFCREERPWTKVIIYSGEDGVQAQRELYCHAFFQKGDSPKELLALINSMMN